MGPSRDIEANRVSDMCIVRTKNRELDIAIKANLLKSKNTYTSIKIVLRQQEK